MFASVTSERRGPAPAQGARQTRTTASSHGIHATRSTVAFGLAVIAGPVGEAERE